MKVTLIMPKQITSHSEPPLGFGYLRAALSKLGIDSEIIDENVNDIFDLVTQIGDIAFLTAYYTTENRGLQIAKNLRLLRPDVTIVLGGVQFSYTGESYIHEGLADFLIIGEAEHLLHELLDRIKIHRAGHKVSERILGPSFDSKELWREINPFEHIELPLYRLASDEVGLMVSRGCPHPCMFCIAPSYWGRRIRITEESVIRDIFHRVSDTGFITVSLWDDSIWSVINRPDAKRLLEILSEFRSHFKWRCHLRVDEMSESNIAALASAGCITVRVGVEVLSPSSQRSIKKSFSIKTFQLGLEVAKRNGVAVWCSMIMGLPGDTVASIRSAMNNMYGLMKNGLVHNVDFRPLAVLPGSPFYKNAAQYGLSKVNTNPLTPLDVSVVPNTIGYKELRQLTLEARNLFRPLSHVPNPRW